VILFAVILVLALAEGLAKERTATLLAAIAGYILGNARNGTPTRPGAADGATNGVGSAPNNPGASGDDGPAAAQAPGDGGTVVPGVAAAPLPAAGGESVVSSKRGTACKRSGGGASRNRG
jgi:hypothetical protein